MTAYVSLLWSIECYDGKQNVVTCETAYQFCQALQIERLINNASKAALKHVKTVHCIDLCFQGKSFKSKMAIMSRGGGRGEVASWMNSSFQMEGPPSNSDNFLHRDEKTMDLTNCFWDIGLSCYTWKSKNVASETPFLCDPLQRLYGKEWIQSNIK